MEAIQFIGTNPNELIKAISNAIVPELEQRLSKQFQPKEPTTYLTRKEVCELLHIDYSTLNRWTKNGKLKAYGMGNRVYYKRSEVEETLNQNRL
ncbi:helix-turn-helix domain-containing protein [Riemerella anatipestifer]|uniref:helix-turn-helix domain-containing protein n=1 Tax=Riemerella anatipestifer TaxID=34085 RepID=UPI0021B0AC66|nr:helix-turn-helix domain-containing protein [Riemerella anatipestifer]MCT6765871.1 helix-turn-helix domain-containing protein [Riemerella anatipestifer]MCT6770050.1 helix-turn-helix domain-containing protein [Riemerella anatipestifer]MCU7594571.1 helix-turn-helix domain-containing protein [Riemerella anatipestifer]MCU7602699.1 helix-turn-helix domain-containing protein [Riemerella anatipestifer]MCU7610873.1 helix-turn-helix domain-containing protein [Riemerella anatipestifer]